MSFLIINGENHEINTPIFFNKILEKLNIDLSQKRYALELNGEIISRAKHNDLLLNHGDKIEIVTAIGGG